jgi:hypothetical protein
MLSQNFVWVALSIAVLANLFYVRDTLKGETQPNRVTFFLWGAAPLVSYFAQLSGGGGKQTLYTLIIAIMPFVILAASFVDRKAYWKITKFDISCGTLSLIALAFLVFANEPMLALCLSVLADFCAALPTILKSYKFPHSETVLAYGFEILGSTIVLLTVHNWTFVNYFFSAYVLFMNTMFTILLLLSPKRHVIE